MSSQLKGKIGGVHSDREHNMRKRCLPTATVEQGLGNSSKHAALQKALAVGVWGAKSA